MPGAIAMQRELGELVDLTDAMGSALETFVVDHYERLIRLAGLICLSVDEAEDAVQAALERAWKRRGQLSDPALLKPWLDRIVVREAIRHRQTRVLTVDTLPDTPSHDNDDWVAVRIAFAQLPPQQRAAFVLHLYLGYSVSATAQVLECPVETVRSRLRNGRQHLRTLLGERS